jgi:hypothetical protein
LIVPRLVNRVFRFESVWAFQVEKFVNVPMAWRSTLQPLK